MGCTKKQQLDLSFGLAFFTLFLAIVVPPVLFIRGHLDGTSRRMRGRFARIVEWMRKETTWAHEQQVAYEDEQERLAALNDLSEREVNANVERIKKVRNQL